MGSTRTPGGPVYIRASLPASKQPCFLLSAYQGTRNLVMELQRSGGGGVHPSSLALKQVITVS